MVSQGEVWIVAGALCLGVGCSDDTGADGTGGTQTIDPGGGSTIAPGSGTPGTGGGTGGGQQPAETFTTLPEGFTPAQGNASGNDASTLKGGWKLVGPLAELGEPQPSSCSNVLRVLLRDFDHSHVDFGAPKDPQMAPGMVAQQLGADRKPVPTGFNSTSAQAIDEWYVNIEGVNTPYILDLWLEPSADGQTFVFDSTRFFPLEGIGATNGTDDDGVPRNFGFTTELHTSFQYQGGEVFTFRGDDDVFVYINNQLEVDLGGVHGPIEGSVQLDSLGLTVGEVYPLDLFQAERNPTGSNFRIETSLDFTDCGTILEGDIVR